MPVLLLGLGQCILKLSNVGLVGCKIGENFVGKGRVEKVAENQFVEEAFRRGFLALKMEIPGWVNWPDRQVLLGHGYVFFIEFKRDGEEPRPGQVFRHKELREKGYSVYVCWTLAEALEALEQELGKMALII